VHRQIFGNGRFKLQILTRLSQSLLACAAYVDLNAVRGRRSGRNPRDQRVHAANGSNRNDLVSDRGTNAAGGQHARLGASRRPARKERLDEPIEIGRTARTGSGPCLWERRPVDAQVPKDSRQLSLSTVYLEWLGRTAAMWRNKAQSGPRSPPPGAPHLAPNPEPWVGSILPGGVNVVVVRAGVQASPAGTPESLALRGGDPLRTGGLCARENRSACLRTKATRFHCRLLAKIKGEWPRSPAALRIGLLPIAVAGPDGARQDKSTALEIAGTHTIHCDLITSSGRMWVGPCLPAVAPCLPAELVAPFVFRPWFPHPAADQCWLCRPGESASALSSS